MFSSLWNQNRHQSARGQLGRGWRETFLFDPWPCRLFLPPQPTGTGTCTLTSHQRVLLWCQSLSLSSSNTVQTRPKYHQIYVWNLLSLSFFLSFFFLSPLLFSPSLPLSLSLSFCLSLSPRPLPSESMCGVNTRSGIIGPEA
jgi:hypothetical protein